MSSTNVRPPRSRLAQHSVEEFGEFANDLKEALAKSVPTNLSRYRHAAVLAITWSNDDIGVMPQTDQLLQVLRQSYNFVTEKYMLGASRSPQPLRRDLTDRIIGHSDAGPAQDQLRLARRLQANHQLAPPWPDWYDCSHLALRYPTADTVMILDSCNAAMAGIKAHSEIWTASGWETTTPTSLQQSFTRFLIDEFTQAKGRAFTASQLHSRLMGNAIIRNMAATPIHVAHPEGKPSIMFHKILGREGRGIQLMPQEVAGKAVIKVSVWGRGAVPDASQWAEWLSTNMPPDLQNIEMLDKYESTSVCVLATVPVVRWNPLPPREAYEYVSRYWGPFRLEVGQQTGLSLRTGNFPRQTDLKQGSPAPSSSKG